MGYGRSDEAAHVARSSVRASLPREEVFKQRVLNPEMNPFGVTFRESRDSAEHPNSLGVMFWIDETGSMREIPENLAKHTLPRFVGDLMKVEPDAQVFFGAIGDATTGEPSPLQVGQFESSDELMDKWLTAVHLVGGGGGNAGESYDLAIYFSARHTVMDCFEKRGRKGYFFMSGDEPHLDSVKKREVKDLIGTDIPKDIPIAEIVRELKRTFHPFFLIPDPDRANRVERIWRELFGDNVITLACPEDTGVVSAILIGLTEGYLADMQAVKTKVENDFGRKGEERDRVLRAVEAYAVSVGRAGQGTRPASSDSRPYGNSRV